MTFARAPNQGSPMISFRPTLLASFALLAVLAPKLAQATDISLDNVSLPTGENSKITFGHIDLIGANLSAEEANRLFSGQLPRDAVADMLGKLKAARISFNEASATSNRPGVITFRDFKGEGVDQGAIAHLSLGGVDAAIPGDTGGELTLKGREVAIDDLRLPHLAEAIRSGKAAAAGARIAHAAWAGFDLTAPDKDTPAGAEGGNLIRVHLNSARADQSFDGDIPGKFSLVASGLSVTMPKASRAGAVMTALGYDNIEATLKASGAFQPENRTLVLDDYSVDFARLGSLGLSGRFGGFDPAALTGDALARTAAMQAAQVDALTFKFVNAGAFEKAVALAALSNRATPDAIKTEWSEIVAQTPLLAPNIPAVATLTQGVEKFIANGKSLTVSLVAKPPAPKLSEMQAMKDPAQIAARFDVKAEADGAAPPLAAPTSVAPTPPAEKLAGEKAWRALVGNTVTGRDADGLPLTEYYAPDGGVKRLNADEPTTGKWIARGETVCFIFPNEKEETCYKVEIAGDTATFTDSDGDGRRYAILKGNPNKL
jgi:hypothetical protein